MSHWGTFVLRTPEFALGTARRAHAPDPLPAAAVAAPSAPVGAAAPCRDLEEGVRQRDRRHVPGQLGSTTNTTGQVRDSPGPGCIR